MAGSITKDLIDISLADSTTGWSGTSGQLDTEVYKQAVTVGTHGAYTYQTGKNSLEGCTFTPATNINMTANYTTPHLYWTMRCDVFPFCELLNTGTTNSGLMVRVTDGSGNYVQWHVAGRDTWDGSWRNFVLDLTNTANIHTSSGTLSLANVHIITWYTDNSNSGNIRIIDNTWLDAVRYGDGLQGNSTTTEAFDFTDIALDDALTANYYGVIENTDGVLFCQGQIILGDASDTNDTNFVSLNETVYFKDQIVSSSHYGIVAVEATAATNPTDIDITGLVCKTVGNSGAELDFSDIHLNSCALAGCTFLDMGTMSFATGTIDTTKFDGCGTTTLGSGTTTCDVTSSSWNLSGQITLTDGSIDDCVIEASTASSALVLTDLDNLTASHFIGDGTGHAIQLNASATATYSWDSTFDSTTYATTDGSTGNEVLYVNDSNASNTYTINVSGGATPTVRTAGATVNVTASVPIIITVKDSDNTAITTANVRIEELDGTLVVQGTVNGSGIYSTTYGGSTPLNVRIKVRSSSSGETRYVPVRTNGTIESSTGLVSTITMIDDSIVAT